MLRALIILVTTALGLLSFSAGNAWAAAPLQAPQIPVADFFRHAEFTNVTLSPDGRHIAVTVPEGDRTLLAVLRVADKQIVGKWDYGANRHIEDVFWVNDERILFRASIKLGSFDYRVLPGDMYASNIDGTQRVDIPNGNLFRILGRVKGEPGLVWVQRSVDNAFLFKLDSRSGRTVTVASAPVDQGSFVLDHDGNVRYVIGMMKDRRIRTLRREGDGWTLVHETSEGGGQRSPLGFDADNRRVYFAVSDRGEPERIVLFDIERGEETVLSYDDVASPDGVVTSGDGRHLLAVRYQPHRPVYDILDEGHPEARTLSALISAFPDHAVKFRNISEDGNLVLFRTYSDVDPGSYYLFDRKAGKATFLLANRSWIRPEQMARMRPVRFTARDGLQINAYLTVPNGVEPKNLPLVMLVHGGPHGPRDVWDFHPEAQFLANRGYAVLQVNYRGSGGYGQAFMAKGFRRWGREMQDDLTDAVRWITGLGIVDPERICIYGASYGGYAALMSVVREPELYRCAIGYVGVYSLPMMFQRGDIPQTASGRNYLRRVLPGDRAEQQAQSPAYNVERITVPIMLVHGARDQRVPIEQMHFLISQLEKSGKSPEKVIIQRREGHGFYDLDNRIELYTQLQAFLDRHIGPSRESAVAP